LLRASASFCGIVERHVLRFVSKKIHQLAHKCGAIQDPNFWFETSDRVLIFFNAAKEGHLSILEWMRAYFLTEQFPMNNMSACEGAVLGNHLKVLKWARENIFPWNTSTCLLAAKKVHFEALACNTKMGQKEWV
jgi:hypothetical protein